MPPQERWLHPDRPLAPSAALLAEKLREVGGEMVRDLAGNNVATRGATDTPRPSWLR
ncbi:hypothetical protein [Paenarthrobacter sp. A20]|uniref:hypothetical protein n=1 Tax=Paenarthrobacter sp. A20 TaxID=2817891 RepID=UPI00209E2B93|nr:hypothetical protein [Paenarthrobacter sp. A20]MCP1413849.1 hypothetical protein [Paenarthrobacter sp. A20]